MNVLISADVNVFSGVELLIYSLLTHNKYVNIYIFTMNIDLFNDETGIGVKYVGYSEDLPQAKKLRKIVKYLDPNSNITFVDVYDLYLKYLHGGPNTFTRFTPFTALRLIADIALPYVDDVFYLDCDVAIQGNLYDMYHMYLSMDYDFFAYYAPDACGGEGEMVAGIMILNLERIRKSGLFEMARWNYNHNYYVFPDQSALSEAGKAYPLPETYSYMYEMERCHYTPMILHFTNKLFPKIYQRDFGEAYFYRKFPFLQYVRDGIKLIDQLSLD